MHAEQNENELTTTLRRGLREVSDSPSGLLHEYLDTIPQADRIVIEEVAQADDKAMVVIFRGSNAGARFLITSAGATIGRSVKSEIFFDDVTVSRTHAVIEMNERGFILKDSGSLNGTYVNEVSVSEKNLITGDQIQIGKFHLLFVSGRK